MIGLVNELPLDTFHRNAKAKELMLSLRRRIGYVLAALVAALAFALASYDLFVFQPHGSDIDKLIARASSSEQAPPESLRRVIHAAYGGQLGAHVARQLLVELEVVPASGGSLGWHATAGLWWLLSEIHLSEAQRTTLFLSLASMGEGSRGFEYASTTIIGVPLAHVSVEQAATLVTIGKAPARFLANRERLASSADLLAKRAKREP